MSAGRHVCAPLPPHEDRHRSPPASRRRHRQGIAAREVIIPHSGTDYEEVAAPQRAVAHEVVCACMQVSRGELEALLKTGSSTAEDLSAQTGAGRVCGGCRPRLQELTREDAWQPVEIQSIVQWTTDVRSFRLVSDQPDVSWSFSAGQHIVVRATVYGVEVNRTYTLTSSATEPHHLEITVKRQPSGLMSNWLFDQARAGSRLLILPPSGNCCLDLLETDPLVCIVGGIGVTPALAACRSAFATQSARQIHLDYSVPHVQDAVGLDELAHIAQHQPMISLHLRLTQTDGWITTADVQSLVSRFPGAQYLVCGSGLFQQDLRSHLTSAGVPQERIHIELFSTAGLGSPSKNVSPASHQRTLALVALGLLFLVYLARHGLDWRWPVLDELRTSEVWSILTGLGLLVLLGLQWWLPYLRLAGHWRATGPAYSLHLWLGPAMLGLLALHSDHLGYRTTLVLSLCLLASLASGAVLAVLKRKQHGFVARVRAVVAASHIPLAVMLLGLAVTHGVMVLRY